MRLVPFLVAAVLGAGPAHAAVTTFVDNPTGNSTDWNGYVTGLGSPVNLDVNFDSHPLGGLVGNFYAASDGVTMTLAGATSNQVYVNQNNYGGSLDGMLSPGEGPALQGQRVFTAYNPGGAWTLTFDFATPVLGVGLDVIDLYNPWGDRTMTIAAYSGAGGTGTLLGSASAMQRNFQLYNKYFMGLASNTADIRSFVVGNPYPFYGDGVILDNVRIALAPVPEPGTWAMLAAGLGLLGLGVRRRRA